jgi:hypothetical protein
MPDFGQPLPLIRIKVTDIKLYRYNDNHPLEGCSRENLRKAICIAFEGRHESNALYFFLKNHNYEYNDMNIYQGYNPYKYEIIFPLNLHYQRRMPPLRETHRACRVKLCRSVGVLHARCALARRLPHKWRPRCASFRGLQS